jgi:competence protein ComEC
VPVYGVLANVLVEPVVPFVLFLALASALVAPVLASAASALASLNGLLVAYIGFCAHLVASLPGAQASASQLIAICVAGALAATYPFLRSPRPARFATLVSLAAICLLLWHERPRPLPPPPPRGLRVTFLDVGQGDATLLQTPEGALLVDEGPPEAKAVSQLRGLGITSLVAIVLTHPQRDHVGGAADVLRRINVGSVLDPGIASESWFEQAARSEARRKRIPLHIVEAGELFKLGKLELRVLWPPPASARNEDGNEYGIVLLVSYGAIDLLLPADVESQVTLPLRLPPVEVLKVAHHGSLDAGLPELLDRLRPTLAVISVGRENDYGHPAPETIEELAHYPGLSFYRTDLDGRVTLESDGRRLVLKRGN